MPITVSCPKCQARLTAPDAAAGKRVKCAKCQNLIAIPENAPGFEVVEGPPAKSGPVAAARRATPIEPPPLAAARPVEARKPVDDDDEEEDDRPVRKRSREDDDEDNDRPRGRSRSRDDEDEDDDRPVKKKGGAGRVLMFVALGVVLLLTLGVLAGAGYYLLGPKGDTTRATGTSDGVLDFSGRATGPALNPLGPTWVSFEGPEQNFVAKFPTAVPEKTDPLAQITDPEQRKFAEMIGKIDMWARTDGGKTYSLTVREIGFVVPPAQVRQMLDGIGTMTANAGGPGGKMTQVNSSNGDWKGYPYKQVTLQKPTGQIVIVRAIIAKATLYVLNVEGDSGLTASDKAVAEFFDGFEPKPKDPPSKKPKDAPKGGTARGKKP